MERLYQQMLIYLSQTGFRKHPAQTPLEYARGSRQHHSPETAEVIDEICQAYVHWRYGGYSPNLSQLRRRWEKMSRKQGTLKVRK